MRGCSPHERRHRSQLVRVLVQRDAVSTSSSNDLSLGGPGVERRVEAKCVPQPRGSSCSIQWLGWLPRSRAWSRAWSTACSSAVGRAAGVISRRGLAVGAFEVAVETDERRRSRVGLGRRLRSQAHVRRALSGSRSMIESNKNPQRHVVRLVRGPVRTKAPSPPSVAVAPFRRRRRLRAASAAPPPPSARSLAAAAPGRGTVRNRRPRRTRVTAGSGPSARVPARPPNRREVGPGVARRRVRPE